MMLVRRCTFTLKSDMWRTLGLKPDVAWRAVSDAVFSVTFFPVIVVGQMVQKGS